MEGKSHVLSGWCTGMLAGAALPIPTAGAIGFAAVAAGAAALNDLDHDDAAATRVLGPLSRILAEAVQAYARMLYRLTRGPGDPEKRGAHRGATHSIPLLLIPCGLLAVLPWIASTLGGSVAELAGWNTQAAERWTGPVAVGVVIGFCLLIAADRLGSRFLAGAALLAVLFGAMKLDVGDPAQALVSVAPWVALAVLVGTITHVLGDWVTECGLYALAPLYRVGQGEERQHWVRLALPKWAAFKTGQWFERWIVFPLLILAGLAVTPGLWPLVSPLLQHAGHATAEALR